MAIPASPTPTPPLPTGPGIGLAVGLSVVVVVVFAILGYLWTSAAIRRAVAVVTRAAAADTAAEIAKAKAVVDQAHEATRAVAGQRADVIREREALRRDAAARDAVHFAVIGRAVEILDNAGVDVCGDMLHPGSGTYPIGDPASFARWWASLTPAGGFG